MWWIAAPRKSDATKNGRHREMLQRARRTQTQVMILLYRVVGLANSCCVFPIWGCVGKSTAPRHTAFHQ
jgi:hypothetical protein